MLMRALAAIALACAVTACAHRGGNGEAAATPTAVSPSYGASLRAKQAQLAELDRTAAARRRAEIGRVVTGTARDVTPANSMRELFVVRVTNHGTKTIRHIEGGVIVYGGAGLHRLGLASFSARTDVPPRQSASVLVPIPLTAFAAEGAGALARASGKPKRVELELTGYAVENGAPSREVD